MTPPAGDVPERRLRVALVCPYAWDRVGGVQSHVRALAGALRARGHEVCVIAPTSGNPVTERGVVVAGRAVAVPANGSVAPVTFGPTARRDAIAALEAFEPDVVHLHEPLVPSLPLLVLSRARGPFVGTFHASARSNPLYRVPRGALLRRWEKLAVRIAVSDPARDLVGRYFPGEYVHIPNGVDVDRFRKADGLSTPAARRILFLSRLEGRKGPEVLIRAASLLDDVELVVAGEGPRRRRVEKMAAQLGVRAEMLGRIEEDLLPRTYATASVYCAPALRGESFGIVLLEAMAAGTPVVCSNIPGFRAAAGDAARLCPPGDPAGLAQGLRDVLESPDLAAELVERGRRRADGFDWKRLSARIEEQYARAMMSR